MFYRLNGCMNYKTLFATVFSIYIVYKYKNVQN
jgi:hypothetical protein